MTFDLFGEFWEERVRAAADLLISQGYFTDEDNSYTSTSMEKDAELIELEVREMGYSGGPLRIHGGTCDGEALYLLYDTSAMEYEYAKGVLDFLMRQRKRRFA
tara:strand:+ start:475 stop:783 length:309 start_codon:yes stop_codon:yes gene_type:complete